MTSIALRLASTSSRATRLSPRALSQTKRARAVPTRNIHVRKELPYKVEDGMGQFLTPQGLKNIAVDYQQGLLDRLNEQVKGSGDSNTTVAQVVISTSLDASKTLAFNYASEALNNSFFLNYLKPPPEGKENHEDSISEHLRHHIKHQFGSLSQFTSVVSAAAMGMFSTGWVWFVTDKRGNTGVIATYGAGTLLVSSRHQRFEPSIFKDILLPGEGADALESEDASAQTDPNPSPPISGAPPTSPASGVTRQPPPLHPSSPARAFHTSASRADEPVYPASIYRAGKPTQGNSTLVNDPMDLRGIQFEQLGEVLYPLFCVSVHEHAWLGSGYGVWGKEEYLKRFWTCLDWEQVSRTFVKFVTVK
ncbi:hypothetical protein EW146_g435 [Bondarzewia mesenterica]|uniref:Manganese/iron superoxide dismutase C-terminal domain-containing protein n=1 Tax=Bondarzewia mesenterica TaxID=1095465 RepID=A0A4S4MDB7_9AGAM|nr:hypothetical protein EW146_g435 [Bondarzewia mesenterica]